MMQLHSKIPYGTTKTTIYNKNEGRNTPVYTEMG